MSLCERMLIVDDEFSIRDSLGEWFREEGYEVVACGSGSEALSAMSAGTFDVAIVDVKMADMDGVELHGHMKAIDETLQVIMLTAFAAVDTAVRSLRAGAYHYVTKPVDPDDLAKVARQAATETRRRRSLLRPLEGVQDSDPVIVGESAPIGRLRTLIAQVARTNATVLILGESGTGKELVARAIHAASSRALAPLVAVNCGAFTDSLLESELFGHEKGSFTGAQSLRKGKLEAADGGTLFLDEIATLSPKSQVDLLRVLETKEFCRIGGQAPVHVDFRVIAATNERLERLVEERRFREDLYYRLNVFTIETPPLRERMLDLEPLARHFLSRFAKEMNRLLTDFEPEAMETLMRHAWPGNVRELANAIERAAVVAAGPSIRAEDLPVLGPAGGVLGAAAHLDPMTKETTKTPESLEDMERRHIQRVLEETRWNVSRAAAVLGVDRSTIYSKMRKFGLRR